MRDDSDVVGVLSAGVLGATLLTVLCGLVMLMSGCQQPAIGEDPFGFRVNVARAAVEVGKADVSTEATDSEDVSNDPRTIDASDSVAYSTAPAVRKWRCTVGQRVNDPDDLLRVLTPFA